MVVDEDADPDDFACLVFAPDELAPDDESEPGEESAPGDESEADEDESEPRDESEPGEESAPGDDSEPDEDESEPEELRDFPDDEVAERSFLAQPEPLKWTAGVAQALRIVPSFPQFGQNRGPGSLIPWITSTT